MQDYNITRTGLPPIRFSGNEIGHGTTKDHNSTRWTTCRLYRTQAGRYITEIEYRTCWQGESDRTTANSHTTAAEAMESLRMDDGTFGKASQACLERAAQSDPGIAAVFVETVE